ncbi:MAG: hypothetical protein OXB88_09725 [Bacteriovoracales bacterium]|nr:hypothetical protein [Bacteriovoracales bacterium]
MKLNAYAGKTDKGPYLEINEDLFDLDLSKNIFMLIDAFGGAGQGDLCAKKIVENMKKEYSRINDDPDSTLSFFYAPQYFLEGNALINAALMTHQLIYNENMEKEMGKRAGASGVFLSLSKNVINILSIGVCRIYHCSLGKIKKICGEDSIDFTHGENETNMKIPLGAFGLYNYLHFCFREIKPHPGDYLILLTDGVYSLLDKDEINHIINKNADHLNRALKEMFDSANSRNNLDNQSGLILQF